MNIRMAEAHDAELLVRLRMAFLQDEMGSFSTEQDQLLRSQLEQYFPSHLNRDCFAVFAETGGAVISVAILVVEEKPANLNFITGKTGTVLNVYTFPGYRRQGIATQVMTALIEEAISQGLSYLDLSATEEGRPLYEKLGFQEMHSDFTRMKLQLITA